MAVSFFPLKQQATSVRQVAKDCPNSPSFFINTKVLETYNNDNSIAETKDEVLTLLLRIIKTLFASVFPTSDILLQPNERC